MEIDETSKMIEGISRHIQNIKDEDFQNVFSRASELAKRTDIDNVFPQESQLTKSEDVSESEIAVLPSQEMKNLK